MNSSSDDRLPVWLDGVARPNAAYLIEHGCAPPAGARADAIVEPFVATAQISSHGLDCPCCVARTQEAGALSRLFFRRALGHTFAFDCVVVRATPAGCAGLRAALAADVVARARFRLTGDPLTFP